VTKTLHVDHLAKSYRNRPVVRDVSLRVRSGQIIGLLGPNGAGKTTCFYMIVGLIASEGGSIRIDDNDLTQQPIHERARAGIGYLPQEASIFRRLSVEDNILAILETRSDLSGEDRRKTCDALLQEFHVTHLRDTTGQALSGGERRRVEIARALATDPDFILLDEPFAGVDPISIGDIKGIVTHLSARGIGVLITDHNVRETLDVCDHAYIVGEGRVICEGTPEKVMQDEQVKAVYLGQQFRL